MNHAYSPVISRQRRQETLGQVTISLQIVSSTSHRPSSLKLRGSHWLIVVHHQGQVFIHLRSAKLARISSFLSTASLTVLALSLISSDAFTPFPQVNQAVTSISLFSAVGNRMMNDLKSRLKWRIEPNKSADIYMNPGTQRGDYRQDRCPND